MNRELSAQRAALAVGTYVRKHGHSPSIRDVADLLGLSVNAAWQHINHAISLGLLERQPGTSRTLKPKDPVG